MRNNIKKTLLGFSLIELLITMVIGLFLLAGIANTYLASKNSSMKRQQHSSLEDNGRIALEVITKALEHTGYTPINAGIIPSQFITNVADVVVDNCPGAVPNVIDTSIFTASRLTSDFAAGDAIGVVYHGDNSMFTDCGGFNLPAICQLAPMPGVSPNPDSARIYSSFFVNAVTNTLECSGSRAAAPVIIAEGVENIQYLYGVDTGNDGLVDRYLNATATSVADLWNNVVSVQVAILVRSTRPVKAIAASRQYTLLDTVVMGPTAGTDRFERAVFSATIRLRNTL